MKSIIPSITIGLDLGDKKHASCVLNAEGEIIDERTITNHRESLRRLSQKYSGARMAHEVGSHSPWISRILTDLGHEVIVANPRKLRAIYASARKSDRNDARIIARMDPQLLWRGYRLFAKIECRIWIARHQSSDSPEFKLQRLSGNSISENVFTKTSAQRAIFQE